VEFSRRNVSVSVGHRDEGDEVFRKAQRSLSDLQWLHDNHIEAPSGIASLGIANRSAMAFCVKAFGNAEESFVPRPRTGCSQAPPIRWPAATHRLFWEAQKNAILRVQSGAPPGNPGSATGRQRRLPMSMDQRDLQQFQQAVAASVREHWKLFLAEGVILVLLGLVAIVVPVIASLAVAIFLGWLFLISGIVGLMTTFMMRNLPGFWWALLSAVLAIAAGVVLIGWPVSGVLSLTLVLIVFFLIEGVASIMYAIEHRNSGRWGWMLVSGIIDLILAAIIFAGLPGTAAWAIGLLVGINMVFGGSAMIGMALHARSTDTAAPARPSA